LQPGDVCYDPKLKGAPVLNTSMKIKRAEAEKYFERVVEELRERLRAESQNDAGSSSNSSATHEGSSTLQAHGSIFNIVK
jgi:hypothetical protein